jgi:hypothetical protein
MIKRTNILKAIKGISDRKNGVMRRYCSAMWISVLASLFVGISVIQAQILQNNKVYTNKVTVSFQAVQNYKGNTPGTIKNSGTINITAGGGTGNLVNDGGTPKGTVLNYIGGIGAGTIVCGGTTGNYTNGGGVTRNDSLNNYVGTIQLIGALTSTGTFDTDTGKVEYNGSVAQNVFATTYGTLVASGTNTKTLPSGTTIVNDTIRIAGSASIVVGTNTLNFKGATATLQGTGSLSAASGTVNYSGDRNQQIIPATYLNLTTSGSTVARTKTASGGITIAASGVLTVGANDALNVASGTLDLSNTGVVLNNSNSGASIKIGGAVSFVSTITSVGSFAFTGNAQTIPANTYTNLTLSGTSGVKTFGTTVKVTGDYVVTHSGTRDYSGNTFIFAGTSGTQTITGLASDSFNILQFEGAALKDIAAGTLSATTVSLTSGTGAVTNNATFNIGTGGLTVNGTTTQMNNNGTINISTSGDINNDGIFTNAGTITVN